jgi:hypothetical protein
MGLTAQLGSCRAVSPACLALNPDPGA